MMKIKIFLLFSVFSCFACNSQWAIVENDFGFHYIKPSKKVLNNKKEIAEKSSSWLFDGGVLTINVVEHAQVEATDEALQLLINSYLKKESVLEGVSSLVSFREISLNNALGGEIIVQKKEKRGFSFSRLLIVDNRRAQFTIRFVHSRLKSLNDIDIERVFNSVKTVPQGEK